MNKIMIIAYGKTPLTISDMEADLSTPFNTNKFNPTGGVIKANSILTTKIIANQIGSKPKDVIIGYKIGTVITIIETVSKKHPKINNTILINIKMTQGETSHDVVISVIVCGILRTVKIKPSSMAPTIMKRIMAFV